MSAAAAVDKENVAPPGAAIGRSSRRKGLGAMAMSSTSNVRGGLPQAQKEEGEEEAAIKPQVDLSATSSLPRLLLFTERAEEVFMLGDGLPQTMERKELARAVMEDRGNSAAWWRLLQHVGRVFGEPDRCDAKHASQIRKLYQKATRIIPESLYKAEAQSPALVSIWLGFAAAEGRVSEPDAREAYEHMARCGIGASSATFYLQYAGFEEAHGRTGAAIAVLDRGLTRRAAPAAPIQALLMRLKGEPPPPSSPKAAAGQLTITSPGAGGLDFDLEGIDQDLTSVTGAASSSVSASKQEPPEAPDTPSPPSSVSSTSSTAKSFSASAPPKPSAPASLTKAARPADGGCSSSGGGGGSAAKAPPPVPNKRSPPETPSSSAVNGAQEEKQAPRTATKAKRLVPTGRLLGLGRAERVRPEPPSSSSSAAAKPKEEGGTTVTTSSTSKGPSDAPPSTSSSSLAPAPNGKGLAPAPPSTPRPTGNGCGSMVPPSPLGRLQPINEDDGTGSGKGSEDTVDDSRHGGLRSSHSRDKEGGPRTETRDLSVRLQKKDDSHVLMIVKTPAATPASSFKAAAPGSAARGVGSAMPTCPPAAARNGLRASPTESGPVRPPPPQQQQQQQHSMHSPPQCQGEDLTHTQDRGRRAEAVAAANLTADGQRQGQRHAPSRSEEDHLLTCPTRAAAVGGTDAPPAFAAAVPLSAVKPRVQQEAPPARPAAAGASSSAAASTSISAQPFSFESLLASRNFMALNGTQYLRLDLLGRGGSSKVFRVLSDSGQIYALKRVRVPPKDTRALESFANEITLLSRLRGHPCIIQLVDSHVDRQTGLVFMLMELGEIDLYKLIAQSAAEEAGSGGSGGGVPSAVATTPGTGWRLSLNFIRFVWEQMLRAVHCVHTERIVHGDLKPANFVFVKGRLKLIDFGIAKALGNDTTNIMRESQVGTVNYMSPEAILDTGGGREQQPGSGRRAPCMKIGRASDVWSLGCILYQLVYGKTPFSDLNLIQKLHCIVDEGYRIPFPDQSALHPDVVDTIRKCLRRDPTTRPPIAGCEGSLLDHPFLRGAASPAPLPDTGMRRSVVEAALQVVDRDPGVLRLQGAGRVGTVCERVAGLLGPPDAPPAAAATAAVPGVDAQHTADSTGGFD